TVKDAAAKKEISIISSGLEDRFPFQGDTMRLQQVFWNILSNSVKFTQTGGSIYVKVTQNISSYVIRLSDNGPGIEQSFIPFLFDKFAQHESKIGKPSSGLGIGLSLVKTIIELHKGSIEVESPGLGQGTTFEITFPRENLVTNSEDYAQEKYAFTESSHRH
ncbi:MAG: ATP-binding protein, partial [Bdellovibrionales bacterium]|nr:ATP-binding protein [Bdellovibrionales bacterium]